MGNGESKFKPKEVSVCNAFGKKITVVTAESLEQIKDLENYLQSGGSDIPEDLPVRKRDYKNWVEIEPKGNPTILVSDAEYILIFCKESGGNFMLLRCKSIEVLLDNGRVNAIYVDENGDISYT